MADSGGLTLRLHRELPAPREIVFRACIEPDDLAQWWGPHGFTTPEIDLDLRVGGEYRFGMQPPEGQLFHLSGEFQAIEPPARLVYTFRWEEPDPDDRVTVVDLSFRDLGDATDLVLAQSGFATEGRRALHDAGWTDGFDRLQELLSSRRSGER
ncbi:MAG TPA: SRPBCC domain-containing protein [Acidimicrobiia bacterium]|nr:SRPBCC domain-containing protein [Acidimicrobiia bacterium]